MRYTKHRIANLVLAAISAAVMAFILSSSHLLDDVRSEYTERVDTMQASIDAEKAAQRQARFERAARSMCGQNGGWKLLDDGAVQCFTHRGHKTGIVEVRL